MMSIDPRLNKDYLMNNQKEAIKGEAELQETIDNRVKILLSEELNKISDKVCERTTNLTSKSVKLTLD